ncbi:ThiJ/PfpI family protein [Paramyrothecium foliicola]|nr:ThiJ/PfpI family protein [Paramyrothecium foliicola]
MAPKKILIVLSDAHAFPMKKTSGDDAGKEVQQDSGFFVAELTRPVEKLLQEGYELTFASPKGQEPKPDPNSWYFASIAGGFYERNKEEAVLERMKRENGFTSPRTFQSISDEELDSFAGVFIPGGHAPLSDLGDDKELGRILRHFHSKSKPTAAICHGPYALLSTQKSGDGTFAYKGYKISSWSDAEEKLMETMLGGEIPKVESALRDAGAEMVEGLKEKAGYITVDREVISGGNPLAANSLGERFIQMLA